MSKLLECSQCSWVHFPLTLDEVKDTINTFNKEYEQMTEDQKKAYSGESTIEDYKKCHGCGGITKMVAVSATQLEKTQNSTINPILWEPTCSL